MKTLLIVFVLLVGGVVHAQNYAVMLSTGVDGEPVGYPKVAVQIGTNTTTQPPFVVMSTAQLLQCISTNQSAFTLWQSNSVTLRAGALADFLAKMDKIESWIDKTQGTNSLTNNQRDSAINDICQTFKKLRSVLKTLYQSDL